MNHLGIKCSRKEKKKRERLIIGVWDHQRNIGAKGMSPYLIRLSLEPGKLITSADN